MAQSMDWGLSMADPALALYIHSTLLKTAA
jgi:hypothetical protein